MDKPVVDSVAQGGKNLSHASDAPYVVKVHSSPLDIDAAQWNALLATSDAPTPFMRHEYLAAMHSSGSATQANGWLAQFVSLYAADGKELLASAPLYVKDHSYGEYIFDWAWARAYQEHGLHYYPKASVAVPFTPVPGTRYLAKNNALAACLLREQLLFCEQKKLSSLHGLFISQSDKTVTDAAQFMTRQTVQFHWTNENPQAEKWRSFDEYLMGLAQDKRKKIRAERRKVADAGISWKASVGKDISQAEWAFFYRCYERTYLEHGNPPYLSPAFFDSMASTMPENWVLFTAHFQNQPIATSLIAACAYSTTLSGQNDLPNDLPNSPSRCLPGSSLNKPQTATKVAYGRYWGALARVDSLHFEACYYQPLQWCIENGFTRFEGGAQGEHKMARGLLPAQCSSAHWLAHPQFADAVARFLEREGAGIGDYLEHLEARNPYRSSPHGS